jgi:hypothetical protein
VFVRPEREQEPVMPSDSSRGRLGLLLLVVVAAFAQPFIREQIPAVRNDLDALSYWVFMVMYWGAVVALALWLSTRGKRTGPPGR